MKDPGKKTRKPKLKKIIIFTVIAALIGGGLYYYFIYRNKNKEDASSSIKTGTVSRQNIVSSLSSSGTISPKDSYNITSMVDGEVIAANFEEGDQVTAGQVLYQIDATSMDSKLSSANNSVDRSLTDYDDEVDDYNKVVSKLSGNTYKATEAGYVKTLSVKVGDKVGSSTQVAELYNDSTMEVSIPFLNVEAQSIPVGSAATLTLSDTLEQLSGTVTAVATMDQALTGGQIVRYVTISVDNPGGLTTSTTATAVINGFSSSGDASFTPSRDITITASDLTSNVTVTNLLVHAGDYVSAGTPLFSISEEDASDIIRSYKSKVETAQATLENAKSSLDSTKETYDNYTITAPISSTVITKTVKTGDKIQNGSGSTTLAVIYDLSQVTFQMNIDELDISNVKVGQSVQITADAFDNQTFTGKVTTISREGTASNGVTYYPVTVTLDEVGDLLPGMNVEGVIVLDERDNVLAVPADALQRGDVVYVKDSDSSAKATQSTVAEESAAGSVPESSGASEKNASAAAESTTGAAKSGLTSANQSAKSDASANAEEKASSNVPEGFHAVQVTTGLVSDDYVEIVSGDLNEGDTVYITQSTVEDSSQTAMMPGMGGMGGGQGGPGGGPGGGQGGGPMG